MASANLDLVRSIYADWQRGDISGEWAHPEIKLVIADGPEPGSWTGLADWQRAFRDFQSMWEDFRIEVDEYRELDGERVLVLDHFSGRGKASGAEVGEMRSDSANVFHVRGGKVTRLVIYFDRERALTDFGLASEARPPDSLP